jgi:hypothetical protein
MLQLRQGSDGKLLPCPAYVADAKQSARFSVFEKAECLSDVPVGLPACSSSAALLRQHDSAARRAGVNRNDSGRVAHVRRDKAMRTTRVAASQKERWNKVLQTNVHF